MHPKVSKKDWEADGVVVMKGAGKGFPVGRPVGVVRWSLSTTDEQLVPLTVNCWPEDEGGGVMNVNIEYNMPRDMELRVCGAGSREAGPRPSRARGARGGFPSTRVEARRGRAPRPARPASPRRAPRLRAEP